MDNEECQCGSGKPITIHAVDPFVSEGIIDYDQLVPTEEDWCEVCFQNRLDDI